MGKLVTNSSHGLKHNIRHVYTSTTLKAILNTIILTKSITVNYITIVYQNVNTPLKGTL